MSFCESAFSTFAVYSVRLTSQIEEVVGSSLQCHKNFDVYSLVSILESNVTLL